MINPGSETGRRVPPVLSPAWEEITRPLLGYLSSPRTIDDIIEWAAIRGRTHENVNNMLAWLSLAGKARHDALSRRWMRGSEPGSMLESWGWRWPDRMVAR